MKITSVLKDKINYDVPPIWFMRQAGRYLPEYREIRSKYNNFLDLCYSPDAVEVTLQPMRRFKLDALIIFSDILVILDSMNINVSFIKDEGPVISSSINILEMLPNINATQFIKIKENISTIKCKMDQTKDLIGFCGGVWTVMVYLLEGGKSSNFNKALTFLAKNRDLCKKVATIICEQTVNYIKIQIDAGIKIIQIFDSWAGILNTEDFNDFVLFYTSEIIDKIKSYDESVLFIGFPKNSHSRYNDYISTGIDCLSLDHHFSLDNLSKMSKVSIQGNLDPYVLLSDRENIKKHVDMIIRKTNDRPFIFNLGHGILKETDPNSVEFLISYINSKK